MAQVTISGIKKTFGTFEALKGVSLQIAEGEFTVLLGPSGCGKTTLLRIVAGLEKENAGEIRIGDKVVNKMAPRKRNIAMVFQNYAVFPHMSVYNNVAFGLKMRKVAKAQVKQKTEQAMELMHIETLAKRYPAQLSGGQRQRVAVARALACEPAVLLMDEPLSNLDALLRLEMRAELKQLLTESNTTTLYVTHDQLEAMSLANRIAIMHSGTLVQYAPPGEVYANPQTTFVGGFMGSPPMNFIELAKISPATVKIAETYGKPAKANATALGIRPEDFAVAPAKAKNTFTMQVDVVEQLGAAQHITGRLDGQLLRVVAPSDQQIAANSQLNLTANRHNVRWFDGNGKLIKE